ncbi:MAG: phosphoenolpyruvate--protein phosphotransferase [bacterium]|nr:phosphoenolpyruvate--protein phosphotransferase [bacterium]
MSREDTDTLKGIGVCPGVAIGAACVIGTHYQGFLRFHLPAGKLDEEVRRLSGAVETAKQELELIRREAASRLGEEHLYILHASMLLLSDKSLIGEAEKRIREFRNNAEWAVMAATEHFSHVFDGMDDPYFQSKKVDIAQAGERILRHLTRTDVLREDFGEPGIIVARDLTPGDVVALSRHGVLGFVTDMGNRASHTAIMMEALGIPAVVGAGEASRRIATGETIICDARNGEVVIRPSAPAQKTYEKNRKVWQSLRRQDESFDRGIAKTRDGICISISANVESDEEVRLLPSFGIEGVGLFRSESLYFNRSDFPSEEEHYRQYRCLAEAVSPHAATIRTLDLGLGQNATLFHGVRNDEPNPALGLRGLRLSLRFPDLFKRQLRAIIRASAHGNVRVLYPMISGVDELLEAKRLFLEAQEELRSEGHIFVDNLEQGVMIETPAAAICSDILAREADFFSIGSNDLTQYTLAVDRGNEQVDHLYRSLHPAMLRMLRDLTKTAQEAEIPVCVCGEMAGIPVNVLVLAGLGIRSFSMTMFRAREVKKAIRSVHFADMESMAQSLLACRSSREIEERLAKFWFDLEKEESRVESAV